jgi:hypothetical protein
LQGGKDPQFLRTRAERSASCFALLCRGRRFSSRSASLFACINLDLSVSARNAMNLSSEGVATR